MLTAGPSSAGGQRLFQRPSGAGRNMQTSQHKILFKSKIKRPALIPTLNRLYKVSQIQQRDFLEILLKHMAEFA